MAQTLPNRNVVSQSDVTLYRNVPFSYDYTNTRWFNNAVEQTTYFNKFEYTKRLNVQIVKLFNDSYINIRDYTDDLFECNYLSFKNENGKLMFAHIVNFETKNKSVVSVYFEIDPIQTYMFDMQFKQSFINREHESAEQGININPEGLNIGKEYVITTEIPIKPFDFYFFVICTKYPLSENTRKWNNTSDDENNSGSIETALEWMYQQHQRTDTHYSMTDRLGPNSYDCSSAVFFALQHAGITTQMGNTDTLFSLEGSLLTPISQSEVRRGDIFVSGDKSGSANEYGHTGFAWSSTEAIHCSSQFADGFGITPLTANYIGAYAGAPIYWYRVNTPSSTPSPRPTEETVNLNDPYALTIPTSKDVFRPAWAGTVDSLYYYFLPVPYGNDGALLMKEQSKDGIFVSSNLIKEVVKWLQVSTIAVNNVVSMYVTEYLPLKLEYTEYGEHYNTYKMSPGQCQFYYLPEEERFESKVSDLGLFQITNLYGEFDEKIVRIPMSDLGLNDIESKLDTAPYCLIELSDGRGNVKTYNPELVKNMGENIYLSFKGSLMSSNYWSVGIVGYGGTYGGNGGLHAQSLISSDPQDVTVLDDKSAAYLQGHKNTINAQNQVWEQQRNYARRSAGIQMATQGSNMLVNGLQAGIGAVMSGGTSLLFGNDIQNTINNAGGLAQATNNYYQAGKDYENNVAMQMATIEDINNLPPSISKQGKSASYTFGNQLYGVRLTVKRIQPFYRDQVRNYFKAFGYKSNRFKVPNIRTRTNWNYLKLSMANITGNIPQNMLTTIDSIFEKGITLWHTDNMYRYDLPNDER